LNNIEEIIADEILILRDSGEIPEVAMHGSIHYLCHDPEGSRITLGRKERDTLRRGAAGRFEEIILRDLNPANRNLPLYRGPRRTLYNWHRYRIFCEREEMEIGPEFHEMAARALCDLLACEMIECPEGQSAINCTEKQLCELAACLGLSPGDLPAGWQDLCRHS